MLRIKQCSYRDLTWHIETTCNKSRVVTYGELKREMADSEGMVKNIEGLKEPVTFDTFIDWMRLGFNRNYGFALN